MDCEPLSPFEPLHAPFAVQELALRLDQVSVEAAPALTALGLALSVTVGVLPETVTVADWVADPPAPAQVNSYSVVLVSAPVDQEPLVGTLPCQPPEAVQAVVSADFHVSVELPPPLTVVGVAAKLIDGAGCATGSITETATDSVVVPPAPLHVSV